MRNVSDVPAKNTKNSYKQVNKIKLCANCLTRRLGTQGGLWVKWREKAVADGGDVGCGCSPVVEELGEEEGLVGVAAAMLLRHEEKGGGGVVE
jgi:hypothetical protein